ncbi:MAG: rod shape-determining protein MreC [Rhodocyclaceae bacterium]|nr:rod shape-determining protein MreC [Rhodocyclaceae bacterium]MBK6906026.1 rod shape-determining protein MreC [Rhodocyclaceae bacterium]
MSVAGHEPPPFFKRGPAPVARLVFFVTLSIVLLVSDVRLKAMEHVRLALTTAIWPLQQVAYSPINVGETVASYFTRLSTILSDNRELQKRQLSDASRLVRQSYLEDENKRLRALLDMRDRQPVEGQIAEILYSARDPFSRRVIIDKGSQQGIESGQAVVDGVGVIGQVVRVFPLTAEVALLTDNEQSIPVKVARNGLRAVLAGAGPGAMELHFLASNAEIEAGDTLVTSGLDGIFLPGLPVATVSKIDRDSSFAFARILCTPLGGVEKHGLVLVLSSRAEQPERPPELDKAKTKSQSPSRVRASRKP